MARTDIQFGQQRQADFGQANSMFATASELMGLALQNGKATLDEINKAVTANNDAKIKQFINSFSKEELAQNKDTINEFMTVLDKETGGMFSKDKAIDYHDNRMGELIARDNSRMLNDEKTEQHKDIMAGFTARDAISKITPEIYANPTGTETQKLFDGLVSRMRQEGANDLAIAHLVREFDPMRSKALDSQTNYGISQQKNAEQNIYPEMGDILTLSNERKNIEALNNELGVKYQFGQISQEDYTQQKTLLDGKAKELDTRLGQFFGTDNSYARTARMKAFNDLVSGEADNTSFDNALELAKLNRSIMQDKRQHEIALGNLGVAQQNADTKSAELALDALNPNRGSGGNGGSGNSNSSSSTKSDKTGNEIFDNNYAQQAKVQNTDGSWSYDFRTIGNRFNARVGLAQQESAKPYMNMSYRAYVNNPDVLKRIENSKNAQSRNMAQGFKSRWEVVNSYLEKDNTLTDAQKVYIAEGLINGSFSFDTWTNMIARGGDTARGEITAYVDKVVNPEIDKQKAITTEKIKSEIYGISQGLGLNEADTLKAIAPYINDLAFGYLPKEWQDIVRPPKPTKTVGEVTRSLFKNPTQHPIPFAKPTNKTTGNSKEVDKVIKSLPQPANNKIPYAYGKNSMFSGWYNK